MNRADCIRGVIAVWAVVAAWSAPAWAASPPGDASVRLVLEGALRRPADGPTPPAACDLVVDVDLRQGGPAPTVWAYAPAYNRADHKGTVAVVSQQPLVWRLDLAVRGDAWVGGGPADYTVTLAPSADGYEGTFTGQFRGVAVNGRVRGTASVPWPAPVPGVPPLAPGEHPRLLFRKGDVAALRARAATPEGQKLLEVIRAMIAREGAGWGYGRGQAGAYGMGDHAALHGLLYVLTGERAEAQRARELAILAMKGNTAQDELFYCGYATGVALAYDLCYDAWDEPFRQAVAAWCERFAWDLTHRVRDWRPQHASAGITDLNPYGSELAMNRSAAGLCALAILGDPVPLPGAGPATQSAFAAAETSPNDTDAPHEARYNPTTGIVLRDPGEAPRPTGPRAAADPGLAGAAGVPVVPYAHDRVLTEWLVARVDEDPAWRPFAPPGPDPLASLGGSAAARPTAGTAVTYRDQAYRFAPLDPGNVYADAWTDGRPAINLLQPAHADRQTLDFYYCVIENDRPRYVRLMLGSRYLWWPTVYLGGVAVKEDEAVYLPAGRVPLLIQARVPTQQTYAPYFPAFYGNSRYKHRAQGGKLRNNWFYNYATLEDTAIPTLPAHPLWFQPRLVDADDPAVAWGRARAAWEASGRTAATAGDALAIAQRTLRRYVEAGIGDRGWWNTNSGFEDTLDMIYPLVHGSRTALGQDLAAGTGLDWVIPCALVADGFGLRSTDSGDWRYVIPGGACTVPPAWRGAVAAELKRNARPYAVARPLGALYALASDLLTWPTEPGPGLPPLTWVDARDGGYVWRNGYDPREKIVAIVERGLRPAPAATQAGSFSLLAGDGPGNALAFARAYGDSIGGGGVWRFPHYGDANVVTVAGTWPVGGARLLHHAAAPDGSGVIALDTSASYWAAEPAAFENPAAQGWGVQWGDRRPSDVGIRAVRSVAVDFSGRSGSPGLVAVADRFEKTGERAKTWLLHVANRDYDHKGATRPVRIDPDQRSFVVYGHWVSSKDAAALADPRPVRPDDWQMRGTFVTPADVKLAYSDGVLRATSTSESFLVVLTLRRGASDRPMWTGEGLEARVTVGGQTVRFDAAAQRLVVTPAP